MFRKLEQVDYKQKLSII